MITTADFKKQIAKPFGQEMRSHGFKGTGEFHDNLTKSLGTSIATTDLRFAWAMTIIFENKNLEKARQFAKWALSQPDNLNSDWFGNKDFHRVLTKNNGA